MHSLNPFRALTVTGLGHFSSSTTVKPRPRKLLGASSQGSLCKAWWRTCWAAVNCGAPRQNPARVRDGLPVRIQVFVACNLQVWVGWGGLESFFARPSHGSACPDVLWQASLQSSPIRSLQMSLAIERLGGGKPSTDASTSPQTGCAQFDTFFRTGLRLRVQSSY